jgi:hypothetical protein
MLAGWQKSFANWSARLILRVGRNTAARRTPGKIAETSKATDAEITGIRGKSDEPVG